MKVITAVFKDLNSQFLKLLHHIIYLESVLTPILTPMSSTGLGFCGLKTFWSLYPMFHKKKVISQKCLLLIYEIIHAWICLLFVSCPLKFFFDFDYLSVQVTIHFQFDSCLILILCCLFFRLRLPIGYHLDIIWAWHLM